MYQMPFKKGCRVWRESIKDALIDGLALMIGLTPVIMIYVFGSKRTGLNFVETMLLSVLLLAGASMITAVQLIASGAGIGQILLSTFLINLRFFVCSTVVLPYFEKRSGFFRFILAFPMMTAHVGLVPARAKRGKPCEEYTIALNCIIVMVTAILTAFWFLVTSAMPPLFEAPISFALPAAFIAFIVMMVKGNAKIGIIIVLSSGIATLGLNPILKSWTFMVVGIAVAVIAAKLSHRDD